MMLILFRSQLTEAAGEDYASMDELMTARAREFPGFVDAKSFKAADGERLTVVWWEDAETLDAWAKDAKHRVAQSQGRERWYEYYTMDVAEVVRVSNFDREGVRNRGVADGVEAVE